MEASQYYTAIVMEGKSPSRLANWAVWRVGCGRGCKGFRIEVEGTTIRHLAWDIVWKEAHERNDPTSL